MRTEDLTGCSCLVAAEYGKGEGGFQRLPQAPQGRSAETRYSSRVLSFHAEDGGSITLPQNRKRNSPSVFLPGVLFPSDCSSLSHISPLPLQTGNPSWVDAGQAHRCVHASWLNFCSQETGWRLPSGLGFSTCRLYVGCGLIAQIHVD